MFVTIVHIVIVVKPENIDQFIEATVENHRHSIKEKGNLRFDVLQHLENPSAFTLYEAYDSDEASVEHKNTAHYLKWQKAVEPWMSEPRRGIAHRIVAPVERSAWNR